MNCGRSARPLETFTRTALRMRRAPTVLYSASGTPQWKNVDCVNVSTFSPLERTSAEKNLLSKPLRSSTQISTIMNEFSFLQSPTGQRLHEIYTGTMSHPFHGT